MAFNTPVLVGAVPLLAVQSYVVNEGYRSATIADSSFAQMVAPTTRTVTIEAWLVGAWRALRPALEAMALVPRAVASVAAPLMDFAGVPVVSKNFVHVDMQITNLTFTQDSQNRDALKVNIQLTSVPRTTRLGTAVGLGDMALGAGTAFL